MDPRFAILGGVLITWKGRQWSPVAVDRSRVLLVRGTFDGTTLSGLVHEYAPRRELLHEELQAAQAWLLPETSPAGHVERVNGGASMKDALQRLK